MQPESTSQQLLWSGRLYAIRVIFTAMALLMLAASDWSCRNQPGGHFWLILFGVTYPHLGHLLLGRFEGGRRGNVILVIDGFFCGTVMAAIGLASPPSLVMATIILFNWMAVGGLSLAALGITATLAGVLVSGMPDISPSPSPCMASDALAGLTLIGYFFVLGRFIHHQMDTLQQQQSVFQAQADIATRARKMADIYLNPPLGDFDFLDWGRMRKIVEVGYQHSLPRVQDWLRQNPKHQNRSGFTGAWLRELAT